MTTHDAVLDAAAARQAGDSAGAWRLADALLAEVPNGTGKGGDRRSEGFKRGDGTPFETALDKIATRLADAGVETPGGGPYTAESLGDLRAVAMAWPPDARHPEAAFRTHQEVKSQSAENAWKRSTLRALVLVARTGEDVGPASDYQGDPKAWADAVEMVRRLVVRERRYTVSANALRVAMRHKVNSPAPDEKIPAGDAMVTPAEMGHAAATMTPEQEGEYLEAREADRDDTLRGVADHKDRIPANRNPVLLLSAAVANLREINLEQASPALIQSVDYAIEVLTAWRHGSALADDIESWLAAGAK